MKELKMKKLIISTIFIIMGLTAHAQISGKSILELRQAAIPSFQLSSFPIFQSSNFPILPFSKFTSNGFYSKPTVPILYSYHELAFFCKIEVKLEKAVKLPIKFRLGDVDYVDRLEGKRQQ